MATAHDSVVDGSVLRSLGGFEWLFYTLGKAKAFNFTMTLTLRGRPVPHSAWHTALAHLQHATPVLNVTIQQHPQLGLAFTAMPADGRRAIPVTFSALQHAGQWCEVVGRELSVGFDVEAGPLLRLVVLEGSDSSEVVVTCHHAIGDGISLVATIRQLLHLLNKDKDSALPINSGAPIQMPVSVDERAARVFSVPATTDDTSAAAQLNPITGSLTADQRSTSEQSADTQSQPPAAAAAAQPPPPDMSTILGSGDVTVKCLTLSAELTAALRNKARQEHATVHAALSAAVAIAIRKLDPRTADSDIAICSPTDIRPLLGMDESLSFAAGGVTPIIPATLTELWPIARSQHEQNVQQRNPQHFLATFAGMQQLAAAKLPPAALVPVYNQVVRYAANISNLREVTFDTAADSTYGGQVVSGVYGPGFVWGGAHEQTVGVVTFDECLRLLHASYTPLEGLLDTVQELIQAAL